LIKHLPDGRWLVDVEPRKGIRFRRRFRTKSEAVRFESSRRSLYADGDFRPVEKDSRRFSDLVDLWYRLHGHTLTDAARRLSVLRAFTSAIGDPLAMSLTPALWASYRASFMAAGGAAKTMNNHLSYVRAVFNQLQRLGEVASNPLLNVQPLKLQERQLSYLTVSQIRTLMSALAYAELPHARMVALVCLATGCRWGEAQSLTPERVRDGLVTFVNTKSKRARSVPVSPDLEHALHVHFRQCGTFSRCSDAFRKAVVRAGLDLPRGQSTHVLRHTFAAHFIMNGGNLLALQRILGHSSITMTMRYSHLAPDHLREAIRYAPVSDFRQFFDTASRASAETP
jgi:site-specific recombinase XerD